MTNLSDHDATTRTDAVTRDLVVIQRNPTSGTGRSGRQLRQLIRELQLRKYRVRLFASRERLDTFLASDAVIGRLRCVVAAGGDGTLGSIVNRHPSLPIATMPLGTENLVARYLNIPRCGTTVARLIDENVTRTFDTGLAGSSRFLVMASAGIDAEVVRRLHAARRGNIHHLSYLAPISQCFLRYRFPEIHVRCLDGTHEATGTHVIVANLPEYGFRLQFAPHADPSDGMLDICVFQGTNRLQSAMHGLKLRFSSGDRNRVVRFRSAAVRLTSEVPDVALQCDGDPCACLPTEVRVAPASMRLVVPA